MAGRVLLTKFAGLFTAPNAIGAVPEGAMLEAWNVQFREAGRMQPRRGFSYIATSVAGDFADQDRGFPYGRGTGRHLCSLRNRSDMRLLTEPGFPGAGFTFQSIAQSPGATGMVYPYNADPRVAPLGYNAGGNLYWTTQYGPAVTDDVSAAGKRWRLAGLPQPVDPTLLLGSGSPGFATNFGTGLARTYRVTLAYYDRNGNYFESPPSGRVSIINGSGSSKYVIIGLGGSAIPPGAFYRVWRAYEVTAPASGGVAGVTTTDEMFLVLEAPAQTTLRPDGYAISGTTISPVDQSLDTFLNIPLYTNPITGGGIQAANTRPPLLGAATTYRGRVYGGRVTFPQTVPLRFIGTDASMDGGQILINNVPYVGSTSITGQELAGIFSIYTTANVASNLELTARSLVLCIAYQYGQIPGGGPWATHISDETSTQLWATYTSLGGQTTDFGALSISRPFPGSSAFSVTIPSTWGPYIRLGTAGSPATITSTSSYAAGLACRSAVGNPEGFPLANFSPGQAVPSGNFFPVGDPNAAVLNVTTSRDALFYEKEDGLFRVTDEGPVPTVTPIDPTAQLVAPSSIALVDNVGFGLFTQGYLGFTEQGTEPVVRPIETEVLRQIQINPSVEAVAFGVPYQSEKLYLGGRPLAFDEVLNSVQDAFSTATGSWSRWDIYGLRYGWLSPDSDRLILLQQDDRGFPIFPQRSVWYERKGGFNSQDYEDPTLTFFSLLAAQTTANSLLFVGDYRSVFQPGDVYTQYDNGSGARIDATVTCSSYDGSTTIVRFDGTYVFGDSSTIVKLRKAIQCRWRTVPITAGDPLMDKEWTEVQAYFPLFDAPWMDVTLDSEKSENQEPQLTVIPPPPTNIVGQFVYGEGTRGRRGVDWVARTASDETAARSIRRGALFQVPCCNGTFLLDAIAFDYSGTTPTSSGSST